jgi:hypothetical protein
MPIRIPWPAAAFRTGSGRDGASHDENVVAVSPPIDRCDAALLQLRDSVAHEYRVHPSVVAGLKVETLAWMAAFRWGPLHRVRVYRVP